MKVVVLSTTEGDDKPLKYPAMFRNASVLVINKIDLLPYVDVRPRSHSAARAADQSGSAHLRDVVHDGSWHAGLVRVACSPAR